MDDSEYQIAREQITRLERKASKLRARISQSHAYYLAGDPRALGDQEYAALIAELDSVRAQVVQFQEAVKRESRARAAGERSSFERAFMRVAKSNLDSHLYSCLIAETNKKLGISLAA